MKKVVVTGIGVVSPLGRNLEISWNNLIQGKSGVNYISHIQTDDLPVQFAGLVPALKDAPEIGFDFENYISARDQRRMDRFTVFALAAADEAVKHANLVDKKDILSQAGAMIASAIGGAPVLSEACVNMSYSPPKKLSPFTVPAFLSNLAAGQVSIRYGLKGPSGCPVTACAASAQAIGDAARMIRTGETPIMLAGGAEACITRLSIGSFAAMKALSTRNDEPQKASRPFDKDRDGFVMAEGAAILVLEEESHAIARGAPILAELVGYGTSSDAYHVAAPPEDGEGAARAMQIALNQAQLKPENIDYLNAHATSTPAGDSAELNAIRTIFGSHVKNLPISSTKSATGHLLGAAGALAAAFSIMALQKGQLPPTLNLQSPDENMTDFDFIPNKAKSKVCRIAMLNAFGFGGVNASLIFKKHP